MYIKFKVSWIKPNETQNIWLTQNLTTIPYSINPYATTKTQTFFITGQRIPMHTHTHVIDKINF